MRPHLNGKKLDVVVCACHPSDCRKCKIEGSKSQNTKQTNKSCFSIRIVLRKSKHRKKTPLLA
jgi:hypothetical protein